MTKRLLRKPNAEGGVTAFIRSGWKSDSRSVAESLRFVKTADQMNRKEYAYDKHGSHCRN